MAMLVVDESFSQQLLNERLRSGGDKFDEVWEGVYVVHAYPADEHQKIVNRLSLALTYIIEEAELGEVRPGVNLATDPNNWKHDYRCPDVVVFLNGSQSVCHGAFWSGPPDFAVEIISPNDKAREKLDFYAKLGTRELLYLDRDPWKLELRSHDGQGLPVVAVAHVDGPAITSQSLPISLQLTSGEQRPQIVVTHGATGREWIV
ncbi:MAG: Uma2 family endonuclease [Planctomycetales bacterium]|nr:Uma2 family endonuclease [Planctomycetales bacterium]